MNCRRGEIVLADLPFTDRSGSKIRPALVVQSDHNNARLDDVIVVMITRSTGLATIEPTQPLIDITTPDGKASGLLHTSAIKCEHILSLHKSYLVRSIGRLPDPLMLAINDCLRASLGMT